MKRLGLALAVLAAMFLSSLSAQANTFKYAFRIDANSLDPYALAETFTLAFQGLFYEPLIGRGKQLEVVPALATDWETTAEDTWRFNLRPNVTFHDGSPFTADDVIFSYERAQKEGFGCRVHRRGHQGDPKGRRSHHRYRHAGALPHPPATPDHVVHHEQGMGMARRTAPRIPPA